jgi:GTP pyrophosphokinase
MGPKGRWVEVQVRSERMDEIAEKGYAAHYKYKMAPQEADWMFG